MTSRSEESLPTLNATEAGLLETAVACNDAMLPINEVGTARGSKRDTYSTLRPFTYALTSGRDVLRHTSWTGGGKPGTFKTILVLSSERSPDDWASHGGDQRDDGETVRLIGLPVLRPGFTTIFDRRPKDLYDDDAGRWENDLY